MATQIKAKKTKAEAPPKVLNVAFVWDMSGSMGSIDVATREGTQGYLMDLATEERKLVEDNGAGIYTRFSLTCFDTIFEQWVVDKPILDINIKKLVGQYQPRGGTALYDAVANTITDLYASLKARGGENEKCLVIVMTDGGENSSVEYGGLDGKTRLFKLIKKYEKKGNWTFVYLGAGTDAYQESRNMGFAAGNTIAYSASAGSAGATSDVVLDVSNTLRYSKLDASVTAVADSGNKQDLRDEDDETRNLWAPEQS